MISVVHPQPDRSSRARVTPALTSSADYWGPRLVGLIALIWVVSLPLGFEAALVILNLLGFGCALLIWHRPTLGLLGIGMLITLDPLATAILFTGGPLHFNTLSYWLLIVILLSVPFLLKISNLQTRILQIFVLLLGLQLVVSPDPVLGMQHLLNAIIMFGLLVYFARVEHDKDTWYWLSLVCGVLAGLGGLVFYLRQNTFPDINMNDWAFFPLSAIFVTCLALPFAGSRRHGQLYLVLIALVNTGWVFLSGSRSRLLIALVCLTFLMLRTRSRWHLSMVVASATLFGLVISSHFPDLQANALARIGQLLDPASSAAVRTDGRSDLALGGWYIFLDHPLGVGTGGFASAWSQLGTRGGLLSNNFIGIEKPAHSAWAKTIAENGLIGLILLAAYVLSFAVLGLRSDDRNLRYLGTFVTVLVTVTFSSTEFQSKALWFLMAGAVTLLKRNEASEQLGSAPEHVLV
jgi:hypothetical protein